MVEFLYIDEDRAQGGRVVRAAAKSGFFTKDQVKSVLPTSTLEEMIDVVVDEKCKVLVTDYDLSDEQLGVQFSGNDLVAAISERFEGFPCFVTTNYLEMAVGKNIDVNLIFPKDDYLDPDKIHTTKLTFFERVRHSIEDYEKRFSDKSARFQELHELSAKQELGLAEVQELIELDDFFESALNKPGAVPKIVKEKAVEPFSNLIKRTTSLVEKIERELGSGNEGS
jgi:hypothetical protein